MSDQAKATPLPSQLPPDPGQGEFETLIRWVGVAGFAVFALWSVWEFLTYQRGPDPRFFLDPRSYPNSILVQFTLGEYLETFGEWRGFLAFPPVDWIVPLYIVLVIIGGGMLWSSKPPQGREICSLMAAAIIGSLSLILILMLSQGWNGWRTGVLFLGEALPALLGSVVVGVFALRGGASRRKFRMRRWYRKRRSKSVSFSRTSLAMLGLSLAMLGLLFLAFLSTATAAIQSDGLRYHLGALQVWWQDGDLSRIEGMAFSQFPSLIEGWMSWGARFDDPGIGAKLMHFALLPVLILMLAGFAGRLGRWSRTPPPMRRTVPPLSAAIALTLPALIITSTWAFIDAGVILFTLAATFAHALWWHTGKPSHLTLAGVLTGFMMGTKYTAVIPAFVLGIGVVICSRPMLHERRHSLLQRLRNGLIFGVIALTIGSPWYIRNWVQTGNPVFPLANEVFQATGWDAESQALWEEKAAQKGVGYDLSLMGAAWRGATFLWRGGEGVGVGGFEDQSIGLTPWLLAPLGLAGLLLIASRRGGWWWFYLVFIAVNWWLWFRTYQSNRLLLSTLVVALPGCVVGLRQLTLHWRGLWVAALIALGAASVYQGLWIARHFMTEAYPLQLALGFMDPDDWRSARLNYFDGARALEELVPENEHVLVIGESRRYYFPPNVVMSDWFDPPAVRRYLERASTPDEFTAALAEDGISHIFINHAELLPLWQWRPDLLRADGTVDAEAYWQLWLQGAAPEGSNLYYFRRRFSDAQAALLAEWLGNVPHRVIWHGDRPNTVGVEVWGIDSAMN